MIGFSLKRFNPSSVELKLDHQCKYVQVVCWILSRLPKQNLNILENSRILLKKIKLNLTRYAHEIYALIFKITTLAL